MTEVGLLQVRGGSSGPLDALIAGASAELADMCQLKLDTHEVSIVGLPPARYETGCWSDLVAFVLRPGIRVLVYAADHADTLGSAELRRLASMAKASAWLRTA